MVGTPCQRFVKAVFGYFDNFNGLSMICQSIKPLKTNEVNAFKLHL